MGKYDSILNAPRWEPRSRPRMPMSKRAAIFQPFSPLDGYDESVAELARETEAVLQTDESGIDTINGQLILLRERIREKPAVSVTFYVPDQTKAGGAYRTQTGRVRKLDETAGEMTLADGTVIPFRHIMSLEEEP